MKLCFVQSYHPKDLTTGQRWSQEIIAAAVMLHYAKTKPQNEVMYIFAFEKCLEGNQDMNYCQVKYNATEKKEKIL